MLFAEEIIVVAAIPGVPSGVLRIMIVILIKPFHEVWKAVHIRGVLLDLVFHSGLGPV